MPSCVVSWSLPVAFCVDCPGQVSTTGLPQRWWRPTLARAGCFCQCWRRRRRTAHRRRGRVSPCTHHWPGNGSAFQGDTAVLFILALGQRDISQQSVRIMGYLTGLRNAETLCRSVVGHKDGFIAPQEFIRRVDVGIAAAGSSGLNETVRERSQSAGAGKMTFRGRPLRFWGG